MTCPLCRSPVEPAHVYVRDGIMSEERRSFIESSKNIIRGVSTLIGWFWPSVEEWRGQNLDRILDMRETSDLLEEFARKYGGV